MNRQFAALVSVIVLVALFLGVNIISSRLLTSTRVDLTQDKLYTLSQGSKSIAANLHEPVTLTLYFSSKAAQGVEPVASYGKRVEELLREFERNGGGKITVNVIDPIADSEDETKASAAGLQPMGGAREPVYLGIVGANSLDASDVLSALDPREERFLEYQVSKLIYSLNISKKPVIGLLTPLPINQAYKMNPQTGQPEPARVAQVLVELRTLFEIRDIPLNSTEIPKDINVLMVVHPKELSDSALFAIDQYVLGGGKLFALVDPYCEADMPANARNQMEAMMARHDSSLNKLFHAWGFEIIDGKLATDISRAVPVSTGATREGVPYVAWMDMRTDKDVPANSNFSTSDLLTSRLNRLILPTAGIIQDLPNRGEGTWATITPLIQTTDQGAVLDAAKIQGAPDTKKLIAEYVPGGKRLTVAARVSGKVKSACPGGKPAAAAPKEGEAPPPPSPDAVALKESAADINVVLIADADFIQDRYWVQEDRMFGQIAFADSGTLVANTVDNLTGSGELISIRARGDSNRPFNRVNDMLTEAQKKYRAKEDELNQQVQQARTKIEELQKARPDQSNAAMILTPEQRAEIAKLRKDAAEIDKKLRQVRFDLRKDVEDLGNKLKFINIGLMAGIVILFALAIGWYRASRRRLRTAE